MTRYFRGAGALSAKKSDGKSTRSAGREASEKAEAVRQQPCLS